MSKPATKLVNYSTIDAYTLYASKLLADNPTYKSKFQRSIKYEFIYDGDKLVMSYKIFKTVIASFNRKAGQAIKHGYSIDLGNGLGYLFVVRIERSPNGKQVLNKGESKKLYAKLKADGTLTKENWKVFHSDEEYIKLHWFKPSFTRATHGLPEWTFYKFKTAGGQPGKGFRQELSRDIMINPSLKALYPFISRKQPPTYYKKEVGVLDQKFNVL